MEQFAQAIHAWLGSHEEELTRDIAELVRIRSVATPGADGTPFGQGCLDVLNAALAMGERYGFATGRFEDQVGWVDLGRPGETIAFWGHLDVVPEGENWDFPPYAATVKDGYIIGRGVQDNKGPAVAALYILRCIRDLELPLAHNLRVFFGTNEEAGMRDVERYLERHPAPAFSLVPDSRFPVCFGEKGNLSFDCTACAPIGDVLLSIEGGSAANVVPDRASATLRRTPKMEAALQGQRMLQVETEGDILRVTARGVSGHTAYPEGSTNAIHVLTRALAESGALPGQEAALLAFPNLVNADCHGMAVGAACEDELSGRMTMVGSVIGARDGHIHLTINIRYPVTKSAETIIETVQGRAAQNGYSAKNTRISPAHLFPKDHPAVERLMDVYNRAMGTAREPFTMAGGTYARKLGRAVSFGMGFGPDGDKFQEGARAFLREGHGGAHAPDECVSIAALQEAIVIYLKGLAAIDDLTFEA